MYIIQSSLDLSPFPELYPAGDTVEGYFRSWRIHCPSPLFPRHAHISVLVLQNLPRHNPLCESNLPSRESRLDSYRATRQISTKRPFDSIAGSRGGQEHLHSCNPVWRASAQWSRSTASHEGCTWVQRRKRLHGGGGKEVERWSSLGHCTWCFEHAKNIRMTLN